MLDSSQFLNEINHFKVRLDTLEKERFELEDKVRRLQVNVLLSRRGHFANEKRFAAISQEENEAYKYRLAHGNGDWIGSRSTSALNGRATPSSTTGRSDDHMMQ